MAKILEAASVEFVRGGSRRSSRYEPLLSFAAKLRPGQCFAAVTLTDKEQGKAVQNQLLAWLRKKRSTGELPDVHFSVRHGADGNLYISRPKE